MNKNQLLDMMNSVRDKYVLEAVESRENTGAKSKSHLRLSRVGLIAAVLAVLLLLAGCVAVYLRLQDMSIGKDTYVQTHDEKGRAMEPTEKQREVINFAGIMGSPEQKASAQWYEFTQGYDPDHALMTNVGDDPDIPNNYEYTYGCYTQEMMAKLDEIIQENQLKLLEDEAPIQRWQSDIAMEALGKTTLLREGAAAQMGQVSGFLFAPYNFKLEYDLTLTGDSPAWGKRVGVTELYAHKGYLPYNGSWHVDLDTFQQWNYATSQGVTLLMAMNDTGSCFMVCQLDSGILMVNINGNSTGTDFPESDQVPGKEAMEAFAEAIDFSLSYPAFDLDAIRPQLNFAEAEYQAAHTYVPETYGSYADYILDYGYGWTPGNQYTFYDLTGDGEAELLLGRDGLCGNWLTIQDGKVEDHWASDFRLCQDGFVELYSDMEFGQDCCYIYEPLSDLLQAAEKPSSYICLQYKNGQWTKYEDVVRAHPQSIAQEEADAIRATHPSVDLKWMPIEDFPMDEKGTTMKAYLQTLDTKPSSQEMREIYADSIRKLISNDGTVGSYYRILDVNGDGVDDLLCSDNGEMFWHFQLYRYGRTVASYPMDFYLCESGVLERVSIYHDIQPDGSADEIEEHIFYRYHEDLTQEALAYAGYNKATASWQSDWDGTPMDTAEAEAILAKYPRIDQGMRPISELIG